MLTKTMLLPQSGVRRRRQFMRAAATLGAASALALGVASAAAQQTINVTFAAGFAPNATFVGAVVNGYVPAVDRELAKTGKYRIRWNLAHSGQIAKPRGELDAVQGGLADMGVLPVPYYFDRIPLYEVLYVTPFAAHDVDVVAKAFDQLEARFPQVHEAWARVNQKVLATTPNADATIISVNRPVRTVADMKGLKIGAVGPNSPWIAHAGATPVQAALSDWYLGINNGTMQGALAFPQALGSFKLCQVAKFAVDPGLGVAGGVALTVNLNFWNKLPPEVQQVLQEQAKVYNTEQVRLLREGSRTAMEGCRKEQGFTEISLSTEERAKWANGMPNLGQEWATRMDHQGQPGRQVLAFWMDQMRAANQPIIRQWDR